MNRKVKIVSIIFMCFMCMVTSCSRTELPAKEDSMPEMTQIPDAAASPEEAITGAELLSMEKAYYSKYVELAETYGTYSLYDYCSVKGTYSACSYLGGVCVVNLLDFNRDGVQDLFVVYSNGRMDRIADDGYTLEIYDIPTKDSYEIEIWTYTDGSLSQILHESGVSSCYVYPNDKSDFVLKYYQNFITVYENRKGFPVIQIYDESGGERRYTNIYYSGGQVVRDRLLYNGDTIQLNGMEVSENIWSENVAGYNKILLCTILADSHHSSQFLFESYDIDYNNTLLQTERVVRYLSEKDKNPVMTKFAMKEGEYISLYLQEIERANRVRQGAEFIENHYFNLYDMNQDNIPELILYESSVGAGTHYHFYTIRNEESVNVGNCGRTSLYANGEKGFVAYFGRMDVYQIEEIVLEEDTVVITDIANGRIQGMDSYPELEEFGYDNYKPLAFCPPTIPMALYTYNQELLIH